MSEQLPPHRAAYRAEHLETSQIAEWPDLIKRYLPATPRGQFVDVGAYDGKTFSNTWPMAMMGWEGLAFEPLPESASRARENYEQLPANNVTVVEAAIMGVSGYAQLYISGPGSTTQRDLFEHFNAIGGQLRQDHYVMVPMMTLDYALWVYGWDKPFELLSIDVEGAEAHVVGGFDLDHFRPRMIVIEMTRQLPQIPDRFESFGYRKVHQDRSNWVFVR